MERRPILALVTQAAIKLGLDSQQWSNLLAFLQSCYCGRVRDYDFDDAVAALSQLSDQEEHALIAWVMFVDENRLANREIN